VICGYKHVNFWCNRDDYGLKRRVTVFSIFPLLIKYNKKEIKNLPPKDLFNPFSLYPYFRLLSTRYAIVSKPAIAKHF